jgi:hypothetical protein
MTKLDRLLAGPAQSDVPPPGLDEVIGYRPRRRKVRRSPLVVGAIVIAAAAVFALPGRAPQMADIPMEITVVYATDWLAEPPGFEWISDVPELDINTGDYHAEL